MKGRQFQAIRSGRLRRSCTYAFRLYDLGCDTSLISAAEASHEVLSSWPVTKKQGSVGQARHLRSCEEGAQRMPRPGSNVDGP
jgi:hypothetical protein